ncbi:type I DNA topoisomerase [Patescibacteria group bacterium]|nr:type I DNA topoisomerase [Patescibacteria group bacterium]
MKLVIVESPTKAKTIAKFLGSDFNVESSFGHVRDLPVSKMSIDIEHDFEPKYIVPIKAKKNLKILQALAKKSDKIILATDEDREGEAIAWHLSEALKIDPKNADRIVFHEITKSAIEQALEHPRKIDMKLVNAQQARRILDRLVGYELSPFLWKKVARGLSAGRVQSAAVRLIVEREREIKKFITNEYWDITALLSPSPCQRQDHGEIPFLARLNKINNKTIDKLEIKNEEQATEILTALNGAEYLVANLEKKQTKKQPPKPFTTSSLQQTANRWLGFSAKQTMLVAQQLYEIGFITYMRTDSLNLSDNFLSQAAEYLTANLGAAYALKIPRRFKTKSKGAQEAHEAIRPSEASRAPESAADKLNPNQNKLYKLIWQRAIASQMSEAIVDTTVIDIDTKLPILAKQICQTNVGLIAGAKSYQFRSNGQILKFDGYLKIYPEKNQEIELPELKIKEKLELEEIKKEQHFTKPPARYSDAGLVKELEKYGIGRPSTYAPIIATIVDRNYVRRDQNKRLEPTDIAFVVNDLLVEHFPNIVDYQFTAKLENDLDSIADSEVKWQPIIKEFYEPFHANLENKYKAINKKDIMPEEKSSEVCDKCGAPMIIKTGRYGKFLACSAFPECKNIKSMPGTDKNSQADSQEIKELKEKYKDQVCEKCGSAMAIKVGKFGPFLACSAYPKCKNLKNISGDNNSTNITCLVCRKGEIVQKRSRRGIFYACNQYPTCKTAFWGRPTGEKCPDCENLLIEDAKKNEVKCSNKNCGYIK